LSRQSTEKEEVLVPSDELLVARICKAEEAAFNILYDRYFQRVYSFSFARLRNHADAEEAVQETFISVFRSIDAFRGEASLISWIYGIARNTVNNQLRRTKTQQQRLEEARPELVRTSQSGSAATTPEDQLSLRRSAEIIKDSLSSVADWQAEVFVLRHVENLPIGEIANRMSRSHDSIRSSLYRVKRLVVEAINSGSGIGNEEAVDEGSDWWGTEHASAHVGGGS
jgi:RNA polymerase sigma-70 factor (ECF subfamily)